VDDKEVALGRVNYTLRAAIIPAGNHQLRMEFVPDGLKLDKISMAFVIFGLVLGVVCLLWPIWKKYVRREKAVLA
jgi:uncharacterized membrane protein YfhO